MLPTERELRTLLEAGIRAPSAENHHELRFEVQDGAVALIATGTEAWAAAPHRRMLALLAAGAVIENIALRSAAFGLALDAQLLPASASPTDLARLVWRDAPSALADALGDHIEARHTNRRLYRSTRAAPATLDRLRTACSAIGGATLRWLEAPSDRALALATVRLAETERFAQPRLHEELFGAVKFELGWQATTAEWLAPATLEVELPARPLFAALRRWPLQRRANWFGAHHLLGLRAGWLPCARAPHLGLIVGVPGTAGNLAAGRAMQRVWLAAEAEGLSLQPMAAATALVCQTSGGGWVSAPVQATLRERLARLAGNSAGAPYLLFRVGYAKPPSSVSGRLPLAAYLR